MLQSNRVKIIKHPCSDCLSHYASNRLGTLVLQVTQQCNLRCAYCAYSGLYYNREHNSERMSYETAKEAIDFFLSNVSESPNLHISFYGGEPLLEFKLIKQCVEYIEQAVEGRTLSFGITTNGTLLTDEIIKFLYEHNFQLTVSLDGSKAEHDTCRVFHDGSGSFDLIMQNIAKISVLYPEYMKHLLVSTVISPQAVLNNVLEYFKTEDVLSDAYIIMNPINEVGLKEEKLYEDSFQLTRLYEFFKFLLYLVGKIERKYVSTLVIQSQRQFENTYRALQKHTPISQCTHHGGPCLPGVRKLFVSVSGAFYPCEKVPETAECVNIGSVKSGFHMQRMQNILNIGELTADECKDCWLLPHCQICAAQLELDSQDAFQKESKRAACKTEQHSVFMTLYQMCVLHEFGYKANEQEVVL